ncbi:MAG: hypothetical protein HQL25_08130 [Candidatus Omnitrophica bacterium]|nr:hypothetical protein [Candidatus Omnitrophota bacterium]
MNRAGKLSEEDFLLFQEFLKEETGLYFENKEDHVLCGALLERMKKKGHGSYEEYYHYLKYHSESRFELRELLNLLTTGETFFFRNMPQFQVLMRDVLPEIIERKRKVGDHSLKIWSAGCSKGDEAFSVVIAIMEVLPDYKDWNIVILGTDVNRNVLISAREAIYTARDVGELPEGYVEKYFTRKGSDYRLNPEVKSLVKFEYHNLSKDSFGLEGMMGADIIFCRNVTIYFHFETTKELISKFYDALSDGGFLFLGHAETLWQITHSFQTIEYPETFIYKKTLKAVNSKENKPKQYKPTIDTTGFGLEKIQESVTEIKIKPVEEDADFLKAVILANQEKYEEAIAIVSDMLKKDKLNVESNFLLATLQCKQGKMAEAEQWFRRVIYLVTDEPMVYFNLGNIYASQNKFVKAVLEFKNAVNLLKNKKADEPVRFGEDFTAGLLLQICKRQLELFEKKH